MGANLMARDRQADVIERAVRSAARELRALRRRAPKLPRTRRRPAAVPQRKAAC